MNIPEYLQYITSGMKITAPITGLCGRIIRGKKPKDFETLSDDPERRIVMLVDPDGLAVLPGKTGYEMLITLGYEPDYLEHKVNEGNRFKLVVFGEGGAAKLATWDNVINMVQEVYPEESAAFERYRDEFKTTPFGLIEASTGFAFLDVEKVGKSDPRFMTYDHFRAAPKTLGNVRAFLYFSVHLREFFTGDGYTKDAQGNRGVAEYIVPNRPLKTFSDYGITDIEVVVPSKRTIISTKGNAMLPNFYKPANAGIFGYNPNIRSLVEAASDYRTSNSIPYQGKDKKKVSLLLIDVQRDFCFPDGTLYVGGRSGTGAIDDSRRIAEFIYGNMAGITSIVPTLDTHVNFQIFSPAIWQDENGQMLQPHDMIDGDLTILRQMQPVGKARPAMYVATALGVPYAWLLAYCEHYCRTLASGGKYMLYIWPEHCMLGTVGHTLVGVVDEAVRFHNYVRGSLSGYQIKGGNPFTENYSVLGPEVLVSQDGKAVAQKNVGFIRTLLESDAVIIGGQASSHCVKSTIDDLLTEIVARDPSLAKKVYVLADCTSAVAVPDGNGGFFVDFTDQAEEAFNRFEAAGMHIVQSTDPMDNWLKL